MLNRPFKSAFARAAIVALVLALAIPFVSGGLTSAQEADPPPCTEDNDGVVECNYDENGTDSVADFSAMDPEGDTIMWSLGGTDDGLFEIDGGVLTFKKSPDFEDPQDEEHTAIDENADGANDFDGDATNTETNNIYVITVKATEVLAEDEEGPANDDEILVRVTVDNVDEAGELSIVQRQPQVDVVLNAMASDPDNKNADNSDFAFTFEYEWSVPKLSRPETDNDRHWTAASGTSDEVTYTPSSNEEGDVLRLKVSYKDSKSGATDDDKVMYVLTEFPVRAVPVDEDGDAANDAPVFQTQGDYTRTIDENSPSGTNLGGPVTATDANRDVLYYTIASPGTDEIPFAIDKVTGQITVDGTVHFEEDGGNGPEYTITVTATDPFGPSSGDTVGATERIVTVTARNVNEKPTVVQTAGATLTTLEIDSTPADNDPEYASALSATYSATDPDADDTAATLTFKLAGEDAGLFDLTDADNDGTFDLAFESNPDFDKPGDANKDNDYEVTVVATDDEGLAGMLEVTIVVMDVAEEGTVTLSTDQPAVGVPVTATLMDPDTRVTGESWKWQRSLTLADAGFADIEGATAATYTPAAAVDDIPATQNIDEEDGGDEGYYLRAVVEYRDNASEADDPEVDTDDTPEDAMGVSAYAVRVAPDVNSAPVFDSASMMREVEENAGTDKAVGDPVMASDAEGDALSYDITGGADMDAFTIDNDGQIKVGTGTMLDFEGSQISYEVEVTATDPFGLSGSTTVTITVTNMNEPPDLALTSMPGTETPACSEDDDRVIGCNYDENGTDSVADFSAMDPEGDAVMWSLGGTDDGLFEIDGGVLTFKKSPDFEDPQDEEHTAIDENADGANDFDGDATNTETNNIYVITVKATEVLAEDEEGPANDDEILVRVTVDNVDEAGELSIVQRQPAG